MNKGRAVHVQTWRSTESICSGDLTYGALGVRLRVRKSLRETEVDDADITSHIQQYILGLDVTIYELTRVYMCER